MRVISFKDGYLRLAATSIDRRILDNLGIGVSTNGTLLRGIVNQPLTPNEVYKV